MQLKSSTIADCKTLELPKVHSISGNITSLAGNTDLPFDIQRVYYLYDVPGGANRGGHAHRDLHQLIVAAGGSFDVLIDDGNQKRVVQLNQPYMGLLIVPGIWRELIHFSSGAICLVLASHKYDKDDYIRSYDTFLKFKNR